MPTLVNSRPLFCLGDSLTLGGTGAEQTPWPQRLRLVLASARCVGNHGVSGSTVADMASRFATDIDGQGFVGGVLMGGINDIKAGTAGATVLATYETLVNDMVVAGLKVLCVTTSPFGNNADWTAGKQTQLEVLNAGILAITDPMVTVYDGYTFMGEPGTPIDLRATYDIGDGLHWTQTGIDAFYPQIQATLAAF